MTDPIPSAELPPTEHNSQERTRQPILDDVMTVPTQGSLAMLLGGALLLMMLILGMARVQRWFGVRGPVQFRTINANGLQEGMDVRLSGYRIGQVDTVQLDSDALVTVSLLIEPSYRSLLGDRSQVRLVQDNLIGAGHLAISADPRAALGRGDPTQPRRRLLLAYTPMPNLPDLLASVAESRLPLNRLLQSSSRVAERDIPRVIQSADHAMGAARELATELRRQTRSTAGEVRSTALATRRALSVYSDLGRAGLVRLDRADADLRANAPLVLNTLRDLDTMSTRMNRLLERLSTSWLFDLLADPSRVPAPLGPAPGQAPPAGAAADHPPAGPGAPQPMVGPPSPGAGRR